VYVDTEEAVFTGTDFVAEVLHDNTINGAEFRPEIGRDEHSSQMTSESPLSSSDVGCKGWREVMHPCRMAIKEIVRNIDHGEIKFESVDWVNNRCRDHRKVCRNHL